MAILFCSVVCVLGYGDKSEEHNQGVQRGVEVDEICPCHSSSSSPPRNPTSDPRLEVNRFVCVRVSVGIKSANGSSQKQENVIQTNRFTRIRVEARETVCSLVEPGASGCDGVSITLYSL